MNEEKKEEAGEDAGAPRNLHNLDNATRTY